MADASLVESINSRSMERPALGIAPVLALVAVVIPGTSGVLNNNHARAMAPAMITAARTSTGITPVAGRSVRRLSMDPVAGKSATLSSLYILPLRRQHGCTPRATTTMDRARNAVVERKDVIPPWMESTKAVA